MPEVQPDPNKPLRVVGRYALYGKLATGGMATVHFGRLLGPVGFSRTVAIKRLHPQFAKDPEFSAMFLDEARLAARIQHPNVVATVDVVAMSDELFLVMDYVRGEAFSRLLRMARKKGVSLPEGFHGSVVSGMLHGLHAAHEATDERGKPLLVVHRDVSPQNVLVGVDGVTRVLDFGVAKAAARMQVTREGQMKGKLSYMAPEQLQGRHVDRRTDVFAAGVVLWEALTGERLYAGDDATEILTKILTTPVTPPSQLNPNVRPELDTLVLRALEKDPDARYSTAREFAIVVENSMQLLSPREVGEWVEEIAGDSLEQREEALAEIESISAVGHLSAFNDSEPQLMRTLVDTWSGQHRVPTVRDQVPPFALQEDAPTQIFAPPGGIPQIDDATQVYQTREELTQPRRLRAELEDNPFARGSDKKRVLWIGAGVAFLLLLGIAVAGLGGKSDQAESLPGVASTQPELEPAKTEPTTTVPVVHTEHARRDQGGTSAEAVEATSVEDLPKADPAPKARPKPTAKRSPAASGKPAKPPGCDKPWFIDKNGIRRIKAECL